MLSNNKTSNAVHCNCSKIVFTLHTMVYNVPPSVSVVLAERSTKLRDQKFPQPYGSNLADLIDEVIAGPSVADRFLLDLAIVTTRHAHAFDVDDNGDFFFQPAFRKARYLEETTLYLRNIMRERIKLLASIIITDSRHLDQQERAIFTSMHTNCCRVSGKDPLLQGAELNQFLDMVTVRTLYMNVAEVGFHGISSYDGTVVYVAAEGADTITTFVVM